MAAGKAFVFAAGKQGFVQCQKVQTLSQKHINLYNVKGG